MQDKTSIISLYNGTNVLPFMSCLLSASVGLVRGYIDQRHQELARKIGPCVSNIDFSRKFEFDAFYDPNSFFIDFSRNETTKGEIIFSPAIMLAAINLRRTIELLKYIPTTPHELIIKNMDKDVLQEIHSLLEAILSKNYPEINDPFPRLLSDKDNIQKSVLYLYNNYRSLLSVICFVVAHEHSHQLFHLESITNRESTFNKAEELLFSFLDNKDLFNRINSIEATNNIIVKELIINISQNNKLFKTIMEELIADINAYDICSKIFSDDRYFGLIGLIFIHIIFLLLEKCKYETLSFIRIGVFMQYIQQ
jgi:hypothetical protein